LITVLRDRLVSRRLACTVARWPRPNRERLPGLILPERETLPPARWAAASAWGDEGSRLLCAGRADAAWPDAKIVLAAHRRDPRTSCKRAEILAEIAMAQAAPIRRTSRKCAISP
jgi:hypothetical protein